MNGMVLPGLAPSAYKDVKEFVDNSKFAQKRFNEASEVIGYSLYNAFIESNELDYEVRECAFLANTIALLDHYDEFFHFEPNIIAGPSFGGMATTVKTGSLSYSEVVWLTHEAAKIARDFYRNPANLYQTMFIYNLSIEDANAIVREFQTNKMYLELVGNLGKIICLCGPEASIKILKEKINCKPKVMATHTMQQPIHSKLLTKLKEKLRTEVFNYLNFKPLQYNVISDIDGALVNDPVALKGILLDGYDHPVRWDLVTGKMKEMGLQKIFVVGPQNIFSQLLKKEWETVVVDPKFFLENVGELS